MTELDLINYSSKDLRQLINAEEFHVDRFLIENYRYESLDTLITDFSKLQQYLNDELIQLVNVNFNDFIKLSSNLNNSSSMIDELINSLNKFNIKVNRLITYFNTIKLKVLSQLETLNYLQTLKFQINSIKLINRLINNLSDLIDLVADSNSINIQVLNQILNLILVINKLKFDHNMINSKKFNSLMFEFKTILLNYKLTNTFDTFEVFNLKKLLENL